jgi:hypothetical protein
MPTEPLDTAVEPTPPPGARLFFIDKEARNCSAEKAFLWTWEGAPSWFYAADHPVFQS